MVTVQFNKETGKKYLQAVLLKVVNGPQFEARTRPVADLYF